jgi:putative transposase
MTKIKITEEYWHWYHNVSECYYHIQITIKYRKRIFEKDIENAIIEVVRGFKERYYIDIYTIGFDKNHVHFLCRFLPKYSGGQVIRLIKSITSQKIFKDYPMVKKELWGGEFWSDGYFIATVSGRGDRKIIESYIKNQGRDEDIGQLRLFDI